VILWPSSPQQRRNTLLQSIAPFSSLTPEQLVFRANQLAEMDAGLNAIQEDFTDYQTALAQPTKHTLLQNNHRLL
jgi:hypothetical protein